MVKIVISATATAMVAANDVTSLLQLQLSAGVHQSYEQRILAAVAEPSVGKDTICVQAVAGDVAPITGSFTARMSRQAVEVAAGSVAGEAGSFCVAKQDVLLIQRTFGLNTARDFEAALGSKNSHATPTTMNWATFDFAGDRAKEVTVEAGECPKVEAGLVQTVEASVSDKQQEPAEKKLDADQLRVCGCRNFLKSTTVNAKAAPVGELEKMLDELFKQKPVQNVDNIKRSGMFWEMLAAKAVVVADPKPAVLLQRKFDTTNIDHKLTAEVGPLAEACAFAWAFPGSWTQVAREVNNPKYAALFKSFNITGGWEHCDKSWVVQGACGGFVPAPTVAKKQVTKCTENEIMGGAPNTLPGCYSNDPRSNSNSDRCDGRMGFAESCLVPGGGAFGGKMGTVLDLKLCCNCAGGNCTRKCHSSSVC